MLRIHDRMKCLPWALLLPLLGAPGVGAAPLALPDTPLTVSTAVSPNVMLLIDNSGSMEHMIWAEAYDPKTVYGRWQYRDSKGDWANLALDNTYYPSNFTRGSCSSGYMRFRNRDDTAQIKCLKLPQPNGDSSTRYMGRYLRYLLDTYADKTDLTAGQIPNDYRMNVAREVSKDLISNTPGMRFGVSHFNYHKGGRVAASCGASDTDLISAIDGLAAENMTPLAESLYEVTRYFRGMSSYYNSKTTYTSPIQYRCQKNFAVVITDGLPTRDHDYPDDDPDDVADTARALPDWDGVSNNDGSAPGTDSSNEGHALYLDDIAKFAWDIDMRKGGTDQAGVSFDEAGYAKQNLHTYTVGFTTAHDMLEDAAEYGNGLYLTANNADQLRDELGKVLRDIQSKLGASSSAAASGGFVAAGTKVYQGRLNSENWSGQLLAFGLDTDTQSADYGQPAKTGAGPEGSLWDAGALINPANWSTRTIITNKASGLALRWNSFTTAEQTTYFNGEQKLLEYLRGRTVAGYRPRTSLLGDIVSSSPQYVGPPNARYPESLETASYLAFRQAQAARTPVIYVGANDGMLHGFDAATGQELLAYVPGKVLGSLKNLASNTYRDNHQFYVDGTPTVVDAFVGGAWRTVLVGGLNKGGQGIYALDVTDPAAFSESAAGDIFKWEFTDANDADLGYTYSRPAIVKLNNGVWAAVFGNGYNNTVSDGHASASGDAALYVVNLHTGALIRKIGTDVGLNEDPTGGKRPNGLATVAPVDIDGDNKVDAVYAGDLFGNLWKFDFSGNNPNQWKLAYKLYEACAEAACTATNRQPITSRPAVIRHPAGDGQIVLFGTGKYLEQSDNDSLAGGTQSFYAILDNNKKPTAALNRSSLQQQSIVQEKTYTFIREDESEVVEDLRVTTRHAVDWAAQRGWYIDLVSPHGFQGERQVTDAIVRNGKIVFTTMIPSKTSDPCAPSGVSWVMEMDAVSGSRLSYSPFDLNRDGLFSSADFASIEVDGEQVAVPSSGRRTEGGHAQTPAVVAADGKEFKYVSTSKGLETIVENPGRFMTGRQSWRELFLNQ